MYYSCTYHIILSNKYKMCLSRNLSFYFQETNKIFHYRDSNVPICIIIIISCFYISFLQKPQGWHLKHCFVNGTFHVALRKPWILNLPQSLLSTICCRHCSITFGTFRMTGVRLNTLEPFSYARRKLRREHLRHGRSAWRTYGTYAVVICNEDTSGHVCPRGNVSTCCIWLSSRANHVAK